MSDVTGQAAPETTSHDTAEPGLLPLADPRLRAAITAEVAARRPLPVARQTLALMTESALLDHGLRADASKAAVQKAVRAAVDGLAARHPALFDADATAGAEPARVAIPAPGAAPTGRRWSLFGRETRPAPASRAAIPSRAATARPLAAIRVKPPRQPITVGGWPLRDALLAVGAVIALIAIGLVLASPAPKTPAIAEGAAKRSGTTADIAETGTVAPAPAGPLSGLAEVVGPAALRLEGRLVRLFGVEAAAGPGTDLAGYLAGRPVSCRPVGGGSTYECAVEGHDLSEVVLFNGGAKAAPDATPALVAAEDHARAQRLGLWRR